MKFQFEENRPKPQEKQLQEIRPREKSLQEKSAQPQPHQFSRDNFMIEKQHIEIDKCTTLLTNSLTSLANGSVNVLKYSLNPLLFEKTFENFEFLGDAIVSFSIVHNPQNNDIS